MSNPYARYYLNQAGGMLPAFQGVRYQRGHGFFGKLFSNSVLPALKFLGKKALSTGVNVAQDMLEGQNIRDSFASRARQSGREVAEEALERARQLSQRGTGGKKKKVCFNVRVKPKKTVTKKSKPKTKNRVYKKRTTKGSSFLD
jgi:hypothetical protein